MAEDLIRFTSLLTAEEYRSLADLADRLKCTRAAAMRLLVETGAKHLKIEG